ncbi:hypothetical protein GCM10010145_52450 [Streptomyces ruber]|uniref:Uncharacterized protein n=2 Tax=Streptomyces TaxID=1883 RepID=A0A918BL65_9ACTN|nr:hypothetical protein GCM10010145_52450 [Streptomyces ruber]
MDPAGQQSAGEVDDAVAGGRGRRERDTHPLQVPGTAASPPPVAHITHAELRYESEAFRCVHVHQGHLEQRTGAEGGR